MRRALLAIFGTIAGLVGLLSFKTHTTPVATVPVAVGTTTPGGSPSSAAASPSTGSSSAGAPSTSSSPSPSAASSTKTPTTKTVTGDSINTRWGPVQVKITVTNGKITSATAVDYPQNNPRDQEINATAIPTLQQESVGQSTANIDMVSGATYTSEGYLKSLQSALDKV
jgi:uncharacterized protein with FMN-binding domain